MNLDSLRKLNADVRENINLSDYTTFQLGGPCPCLISCQEPQQLEEVVGFLNTENIEFILIGRGSNLLVSDLGVPCVVVQFVSDQPLIEQDGAELIVGASTTLDDLALYAAERGLNGLNYTSGIPGTVAGAVVGNAGAFGQQIGDYVRSVSLLTKAGVKKEVLAEDLQFSYRNSLLKTSEDIILSVRFALSSGNKDVLLREREDILNLRKEKHPDYLIYPCAGSFFRNIEPTSSAEKRQAAGWFLEKAGAKKMSCGGAKVFDKHANIIINSGKCTAQDVFTLSQAMSEAVQKKFNLDLIREVRLVGQFDGVNDNPSHLIW